MITGNNIFKAAMAILDEFNSEEKSLHFDTVEFQSRAPYIINILIGECYPISSDFNYGQRDAWTAISSLDDEITGIDSTVALVVMPYGLAATLYADENPAIARFCQERYEELLRRFKHERPAEWQNIEDIYEVTGAHNDAGSW